MYVGKKRDVLFVAVLHTDPCFLQQAAEFFQFRLSEMADQLFVEFIHGTVHSFEQILCRFREGHINDSAILRAAFSRNESLLLQPIQQPGHGGDDLNHPVANFQTGHRLAFTPEDSQDVVLRVRQIEFTKQPTEPILKLVARPQDVQNRLLIRRIERTFLFQFVLKSAVWHVF